MTFFLRDQIFKRIEKRIEALDKGYRQNVGLLGLPGLGKTHLLNDLFYHFSNRPGLIPVYVDAEVLDFDHLIERWSSALLSGIFLSRGIQAPIGFQSLKKAAEPIVPKTIEKLRQLRKNFKREKSAAALRELFALSGAAGEETGKNILMILDEFQALERLPFPDPFSLLGKEIMVEKNTLYLVASSKPDRARDIFREKLSLLFGNFEIVDLLPFGFQETVSYLEKRLPLRTFSDSQKSFLIRMTDGNPVYLDWLCEQLETCLPASKLKSENALLSIDDQAVVPTEFLIGAFEKELLMNSGRIRALFENRLEKCRNMGKDSASCLRALMAISHGRRKLLGISSYIEKKTQETKKILQKLLQEGLIARKGGLFVIEDGLFRFWLKEVKLRLEQCYLPDLTEVSRGVRESLRNYFDWSEAEPQKDLGSRVEMLLREFRNESIEIDQKKISCPQFSEIVFHPGESVSAPIIARHGKAYWICKVFRDAVHEDDMMLFISEIKLARKKADRRLVIALTGIDQNARLMAQDANIQIWDLRTFNAMLDLYDLPKYIFWTEQESHGQALGALAQNVHSA